MAVLMHLALLAFFWIGIDWRSETPLAVEAEVWDIKVREAAPKPVAEEIKEAPKPPPVVKPVIAKPPEEAPAPKVDIALEQEKKRKKLAEKRLAEEQLAKEKLEQKKQDEAQLEKENKENSPSWKRRKNSLWRKSVRTSKKPPREKNCAPMKCDGLLAILAVVARVTPAALPGRAATQAMPPR